MKQALLHYLFRYLDAYLPANHSILNDSTKRRRLRLFIATASIFDLILFIRLPAAIDIGGVRLPLFLFILTITNLALIWLFITNAKGFQVLIWFFVAIGILHNLVDSYLIPIFPSRTIPFMYMIILSAYLLSGRWLSFFAFATLSVGYTFIAFKSTLNTDNNSIMLTNAIVSGLMVWVLSGIYDYFRETTEQKLIALNQERDKDLKLAAQLQNELVPQSKQYGPYLISARNHSAIAVGGDYYEALRSGNYSWFAIGDVSGHGLQAGMLSMQIRSMLMYLVTELGYNNPRNILVELNNSFYQTVRKLNIRSYMTFLLARLDDNGRLLFTGSHQKVIILRAADKSIEIIPAQGIWLGLAHLNEKSRVFEFETDLKPNDMIFLFTDGLTEGRNQSGEMFGFDRVLNSLRHSFELSESLDEEKIIDRIIVEFDNFCHGQDIEDDLTIFCIRRLSGSNSV
ncbi:MAG: serine/threonine-protein phosphatase [Leptonema sp. (in: Bacteria)]|nr:serine/threonine-protein phosphatase [Leptonema sp. (in: bacteria)]